MSLPDCTDICDIIIQQLTDLGFKVSDDEDHTEMIEQLAQCKLVRIHPVGEEKVWPLWNLTGETIKAIAREKGLSLVGKDFDEIARQTGKGINAALDFVWEEAIENAIKNTKAEWEFTIISFERIDFSEHGSGNMCMLNETWKGEVQCKAEDVSLALDFVLEHHVSGDGNNNDVKINSPMPALFTEDDWDDFVCRLENFICIDYKSDPWKAGE